MKKIILINLAVFIILFAILEFISYLYLRADSKEFMDNYNKAARKENNSLLTQKYGPIKIFDQNDFDELRKINIGNRNKPSVLFFGCSYMYGASLSEEETLPYYIYKKTDRTTINRAIPGGSILNMFHDLADAKFLEKIKEFPQPDYVVYLWINDHLNRISNIYRGSVRAIDNPYYFINTQWIEQDGKLKEIYPKKWEMPFYTLYCTKAYHFFYSQNFSKEKKDAKMLRYFLMANKSIKEIFPNSKFVIIEYKDGSHELMTDSFKQNLEEKGITVLNAEKLAGHELDSEKWRASDNEHPNGKAFYDVANGLIKALNL